MDGYAGNAPEPLAQEAGIGIHARADCVHAHVQRLLQGIGQPAHQGHRLFAAFQELGAGMWHGHAILPHGRRQGVDESRGQPRDRLGAHVRQRQPARPAQMLADRRHQHIAAQGANIHRPLPQRLRRVHDIGNAVAARYGTDLGRRVD